MPVDYFLGIDFGTSGCRCVVIDRHKTIQAQVASPFPQQQTPQLWWSTLERNIQQLKKDIDLKSIRTIAIDGTSATLLLTDKQGAVVSPVLMYHDDRYHAQAEIIKQCAPDATLSQSANSSLAKLLYLYPRYPQAYYALHQADWMSNRLAGIYGYSDYNNCLKMGFDPIKKQWLPWIDKLSIPAHFFPQVNDVGSVLGQINPQWVDKLGFNQHTYIVNGTTDSTAAFLATGANKIGDAVTCLGSTLVFKILGNQPINMPSLGVYSHRLGDKWLIGGASNSGGAVLRHYFSVEKMRDLTPQLARDGFKYLDYYPLLKKGERFPFNDAEKQPYMPVIADEVQFFQALLEGMSAIEQQAYALLEKMGAPPIKRLFTTGGGSQNLVWTHKRHTLLAVPFATALNTEAAYGCALLALKAVDKNPVA